MKLPSDARQSPSLPVWVTPDGRVYVLRGRTYRRCKAHYAAGYAKIEIRVDGKRRQQFVHLLVAELFLPPKPRGYRCRHIGPRKNNRVANLMWDTPGNAIKPALPRGEQHYAHKLTEPEVLEIIELLRSGGMMKKSIAGLYGVSAETVSAIWAGRCWSHLPRPWRQAA